MEAETRERIERECARLVNAYAQYIDLGQAERVVELFTEDAVWEGPGTRMAGREEIRKGFAARQRSRRVSRHVCTNLRVDVVDEDEARGIVYLTLYRHDPQEGAEGRAAPLDGPVVVGHYRDRFRRVDGAWRIAHREIEVAFARGARPPHGAER